MSNLRVMIEVQDPASGSAISVQLDHDGPVQDDLRKLANEAVKRALAAADNDDA